MPETQFLTDANGLLVCDERGHSVLTAQHRARQQACERWLTNVDAYLDARQVPIRERIRAKVEMGRTGDTAMQVLARLRLAELIPADPGLRQACQFSSQAES